MKANKMQYILLAVLVLGLGGLTVVYATLTQQLSIASTAQVKGGSWDIVFENPTAIVPTGAAEVTNQPNFQSTSITDLAVSFTKPGDTITYTFDIANNGTIDAMIDAYKINTIANGITCTDSEGKKDSADATLVCNNLVFTLTYAENTTEEETGVVLTAGTPVAKDQKLKSEQSVPVTLTIGFDQAATDVPANDVAITGLDVDIDYIQD